MTDDAPDKRRTDDTSDDVEWEYAVCVLGSTVCAPDEHPRLSAISCAQDDLTEAVMWRRADTDDAWTGPAADWHVDIPGFAPPRAGLGPEPAEVAPPGRPRRGADDDHTWEHIVDSYRDAVAFMEAVRVSDGPAMIAIEADTDCDWCLLQSLAEVGARLGDRDAAERAAHQTLQALARGTD